MSNTNDTDKALNDDESQEMRVDEHDSTTVALAASDAVEKASSEKDSLESKHTDHTDHADQAEHTDHKNHKKNNSKKSSKPTHHATIMRGVVTPIFGMLAVTSLVFAILFSTVWKPLSTVTASVSGVGVQTISTDYSVLNLVADTVSVRATSSSSNTQICVATASATDASGYSKAVSGKHITGMSSWTALSTVKYSTSSKSGSNKNSSSNSSSSSSSVSFKDLDNWTSVKCGTGSVTVKNVKAGDSKAVVVHSDKNISSVSLTWNRTSVPNYALPYYIASVVLALIAVLCASVFARERTKKAKKNTLPEPSEQDLQSTQVLGAVIDSDGNQVQEENRSHRRSHSHRAQRSGRRKSGLFAISRGEDLDTAQNDGSVSFDSSDSSDSSNSSENASSGPQIVDPRSVNMLVGTAADSSADSSSVTATTILGRSSANSQNSELPSSNDLSKNSSDSEEGSKYNEGNKGNEDNEGETTMTVSADEFAAYFARLAAEKAENTESVTEKPAEPDKSDKPNESDESNGENQSEEK